MNPEIQTVQDQLATWLQRKTPSAGVRRVVSLSAAIASEIGNVREENQDRAAIVRGRDMKGHGYAVVAVADGIGGMRGGSTCAAITLGAFFASISHHVQSTPSNSKYLIRRAVNDANQAVFTKFKGDGGSTLVALLIRQGHPAFWLSVGDSRVYGSTGSTLKQISVDDTIAGQLGKDVESGGEQSKLLQFIGMGVDMEPHIAEFDSESFDSAVLTTDGVHYLAPTPGWLGQIVRNAPDSGICVKRLVDLAKWCGGSDNATIAMIPLSGGFAEVDKPPYQYIEVWDAFGELQIISNEIKSSPPHQQEISVTQESSVSSSDAQMGQGPPKPATQKNKPSSNKGPRKAKKTTGKSKKNASAQDDEGSPQLSVDFPTKSN